MWAELESKLWVLLTPQSRFCIPRSSQMLVSPPLPHIMPPRGARQGRSHGSSLGQNSSRNCGYTSHRRADSAFLNHLTKTVTHIQHAASPFAIYMSLHAARMHAKTCSCKQAAQCPPYGPRRRGVQAVLGSLPTRRQVQPRDIPKTS